MKNLPISCIELVDILDKEIKPASIEPGYDKEQMMFQAGKRWVVDYLLKIKNRPPNYGEMLDDE